MERWVPLLQIFLRSPSPEGEASLWFQNQNHRRRHHRSQPHAPPLPPSTSSFLSLLLAPTSALQLKAPTASSSPERHELIWIQILPPTLQSRILSFLAVENHRFCRRRLRSLAAHILGSNTPASPDFWVRKAALNLLDAVSSSDPTPLEPLLPEQHLQQASEEEEDFYALPQWLKDSASAANPLLPWLPLPVGPSPKTARRAFGLFSDDKKETIDLVTEQEEEQEQVRQNREPESSSSSASPLPPLDPQIHNRASALKSDLLASDSASEAIRLAREIRQLCLDSGAGNQLTVLGLTEPWEADDLTVSLLLSHLAGEDGLNFVGWPSHVLCSVSLPKLLVLRSTASRVLLSATIGFCKLHPTAAVEALLLPLALRKEGINVMICDAMTRILRECLHPSHVSAFCQRLLCGESKDRRPVCLPCHRELIFDELVWTEPLFMLFQHILNWDVPLTPDTTDRLVSLIDEVAGKFSTSLKFGNFMLGLVTKCGRASSIHRVLLERAAGKTDTFVTKSILSKLAGKDQEAASCFPVGGTQIHCGVHPREF
ncbi:uncharacterized protein LOC103709583 [Phoenix dactylifera]|uniref:Uncharacterized protein LOC103709583 n=1 Tax=Phoenix dactylifera TaxID=42345 RepID=A0A8B7C784_PHODC|nr:uncharacterized protein LOC103709583 [Phoenix dactylifera]